MDGASHLTGPGPGTFHKEGPGLLLVESVSFSYPGSGRSSAPVLREVSLEVRGPEIVVLLGPSGCGKSSLLTLIAGFHQPDSGRILLDGSPVQGPGPDRVMVFQSYTSFPWLTVLENVAFGISFRHLPKEEVQRRSERALEMVGLSAYAGLHPHELSGGMRQRVAIARALAARPRLLLMDEPFGALDTHTKAQVQENLLLVLDEEPMGVVFVTHDIEEALFLGDRIHLLSPRPAHVVHTLEVPLARPRQAELRFSSPFVSMRKDLITRFREVHG